MSEERGGFIGFNYVTAFLLFLAGGYLLANPDGQVPERFHPVEAGGGAILLGIICVAIAVQRTLVKLAMRLLVLLGLAYGGLVFHEGGVPAANARLKEWLGVAAEKGKEAADKVVDKAAEGVKDAVKEGAK